MHLARIVRAALALVVALTATGLGSSTGAAAAGTACEVDYVVTDQWRGGFGASVTLTNLGDPLSGWTLEWAFTAGQRIGRETWNGVFTQTGSTVRVRNVDHNGAVATGASVRVGFIGAWSGANPAPTSFTVNGVPCTGLPEAVSTTTRTTSSSRSTPAVTTESPAAATTTTTATTTTSAKSASSSPSSVTTGSSAPSSAASTGFDWPTATSRAAVVLSADVSTDSSVNPLLVGLLISLFLAAVGVVVLFVLRRRFGRMGEGSGGDPGHHTTE